MDDGVTETTVEASAVQSGAAVAIEPADADIETDGHKVALAGLDEITVTVTSADESRMQTYRVALSAAGPAADCMRGAVSEGFSLVVYEGGGIEELVACAESRHVTAVYALSDGEYVSYVLDAPDFVSARFAQLFAGGVPALTPLTVKSDGPATAAVAGSGPAEPLATCLQGEIAEGFSLVVSSGGSVDELVACSEGLGIGSLYVLHDGTWVSYIPGAPGFVNGAFRELFADGVPAARPLVARSE